ncbi:hypothetical protein HY643_00800 [Candidatus Woesearchaeota archaeon]|nr:hypothetical protein [Candidatus Woesearchaeota archaeon]
MALIENQMLLILYVILGAVAAMIYALRRIFILERRILMLDQNILNLDKKISTHFGGKAGKKKR